MGVVGPIATQIVGGHDLGVGRLRHVRLSANVRDSNGRVRERLLEEGVHGAAG